MVKYFIAFISFLFFSCTAKNTNVQLTEIGKIPQSRIICIEKEYPEIEDTISITQIADSLFYIQLESIGTNIEIGKVQLDDSLLFIRDDDSNSLLQYHINGKFIKKINSQISCFSFNLLRNKKLVITFCNKGLAVYDYHGKLIKRTELNHDIMKEFNPIGNSFAAIDTSQIILSIWNEGKNENRLLIINQDGQILNSFPNTEKFISDNLPRFNASRFHRCLFSYYDTIMYHPYYSDTLFLWKNDDEITPCFVEHKIPKVPIEQRLEYSGDVESFKIYCLENNVYATRFFVNQRFILVVYNNGRLYQTLDNYLLYDKHTNKLYRYKQEFNFNVKTIHYGIFNDYDGGLPFVPIDISDDYMISVYNSKFFKTRYLEGQTINCKGDTCREPSAHYNWRSDQYKEIRDKNILNQFVSNIDEKGGPVLMVVKLKVK